MDGKGSWRDNVFIERFWWSLEHEHVYMHAYDDLRVARQGIGTYMSTTSKNAGTPAWISSRRFRLTNGTSPLQRLRPRRPQVA